MNVQWSTLNRVVPKETTVCMSSHTVDHCRLQVNPQWSTAKSRVVMGTTVTPITVYSKLLEVQYGCRVGC